MESPKILWIFSITFLGMWLEVCTNRGGPGDAQAAQPSFSFKLVDMYACDETKGKELIFSINDVSISRHNRTQYVINGELCAKEDLLGDWAASLKIEHQDSNDSGMRKIIMDYPPNSVCEEILPSYQEKILEMSHYVENNMNTLCPIKANCYPVKKLPIDAGNSKDVLPGFYYFSIRGTMNGEVIWCSTTVFECQEK